MFPRMQMKDIFERCERLGTKMPVKVYLRKMRTGQIYDFNQVSQSSQAQFFHAT